MRLWLLRTIANAYDENHPVYGDLIVRYRYLTNLHADGQELVDLRNDAAVLIKVRTDALEAAQRTAARNLSDFSTDPEVLAAEQALSEAAQRLKDAELGSLRGVTLKDAAAAELRMLEDGQTVKIDALAAIALHARDADAARDDIIDAANAMRKARTRRRRSLELLASAVPFHPGSVDLDAHELRIAHVAINRLSSSEDMVNVNQEGVANVRDHYLEDRIDRDSGVIAAVQPSGPAVEDPRDIASKF